MKFRSWRMALAIMMLLVLAGLVAVLFPPAPKPVPLPSPNGYDDFVAAGGALVDDPSDFRQWTREELASFEAKNSNTWTLTQEGLKKGCRAPPVRKDAEFQRLIHRMTRFKKLAQALAARSRLAWMEGRTNEAVSVCLDGVQMANGMHRGGLLIEALVGLACEQIQLAQLSGIMNNLDGKTALKAARRLAELDAQEPSIADTLSNERAFSQSFDGIRGTLSVIVDRLLGRGQLASVRKSFEAKWTGQAVTRRQLILRLARRAYQMEKGRLPADDKELVPDFLPALPIALPGNTNRATGTGRP
jgi:hypothetical protein